MERPSIRNTSKQKVRIESKNKLDITCIECSNTLDGKDININNSLAKCSNCNAVYKLDEDTFFSDSYNYSPRDGRPEMIMPEGTDVLTLSDSIDIRVDWLQSHPKGALGFLTVFATIWNGALALFATQMIASGAYFNLLFLSIHLIVGLGLLAYISSVYLNYTDIIVTSDYINISHRPLKNPFVKEKHFRTEHIEQLYVVKYTKSTTNGRPNYAYSLNAKVKNKNAPIVLLKGMNRETQLYLEQEIERYLNITDTNVPNAISSM